MRKNGGSGMKSKDFYKKYKPTVIEVNSELRIVWVKKDLKSCKTVK